MLKISVRLIYIQFYFANNESSPNLTLPMAKTMGFTPRLINYPIHYYTIYVSTCQALFKIILQKRKICLYVELLSWGDHNIMIENNLKTLRHQYQMNQTEFAKLLNILPSQYNIWERQVKQPNRELLTTYSHSFVEVEASWSIVATYQVYPSSKGSSYPDSTKII